MRVTALLVPAFLAVLVASACSSQGEGDFCSLDNGASGGDCASGLTCQPAPGIPGNIAIVSKFRCCPADLTQATTEVCTVTSGNVIDAGLPVPPAFMLGVPDAEAGTAPETGSADTGSEAGAGASDATVDAPHEAGTVPDAGPAPDAATDGSPE
jgi:hypothetical protein